MRIMLPPECAGLDMSRGDRYNKNRAGYVEVESIAHQEQIKKSFAGTEGFLVFGDRVAIAGTSKDGKECTCGFAAWPWQVVCPKCNQPLDAKDEVRKESAHVE